MSDFSGKTAWFIDQNAYLNVGEQDGNKIFNETKNQERAKL